MARCCFFIFAVFLIWSWTPATEATGGIVEDMAAFDRVYVAVLFSTGDENRVTSKKMIKGLEAQWMLFKKDHFNDFRHNRSAKNDFAEINQIIEDAARLSRLNGPAGDVHEILEGVRITFFHFRRRNALEYYPDYLTKFHIAMQGMVFLVKNKTPESLTDSNIMALKNQLTGAAEAWNEAAAAKCDRRLFLMNKDSEAKRRECIKNTTESLARLKQALESTDKEAIVAATLSTQAESEKLYALFGDIESVN